DVLGEARVEPGELDLERLGAPALLRGQVGARALELLDGLAQVARPDRVEALGVVRGGVALDDGPEVDVGGEARDELGVLGQDLAERGPRLGRVHRVVEVPDDPEDAAGPLHEALEAPQHVVVSERDRKSTRLNSSHVKISYAVFCLKKKK